MVMEAESPSSAAWGFLSGEQTGMDENGDGDSRLGCGYDGKAEYIWCLSLSCCTLADGSRARVST